ncbi:hypothetical protein NQ315_004561 [Exocentrus adspersus]|uniref:Uncharacterized protein n=1 Tax=Exocentrus adspersus TaxID=1586481 RepID=A0AAV8VNZ2_9CUCU|nr:hypothetical protein NQ315_004561 [Exocentrus adspersus]
MARIWELEKLDVSWEVQFILETPSGDGDKLEFRNSIVGDTNATKSKRRIIFWDCLHLVYIRLQQCHLRCNHILVICLQESSMENFHKKIMPDVDCSDYMLKKGLSC